MINYTSVPLSPSVSPSLSLSLPLSLSLSLYLSLFLNHSPSLSHSLLLFQLFSLSPVSGQNY